MNKAGVPSNPSGDFIRVIPAFCARPLGGGGQMANDGSAGGLPGKSHSGVVMR